MRRALLILFVLGSAAVLGAVVLMWTHREFRVSGTITVAAHLQRRLPQGSVTLFVIAKNRGGVPVAMQRIVNPQFPASFQLRNADLIVPHSRFQDSLLLEVEMNSHGTAGAPRPGDLRGAAKDLVFPGEKRVHIVIDKEV
ncbi:MAG: hypothetical protein HY924_11915 [Elusimicrobia bacterium]|nr:hypothetical protein [Elusimicrobiota bacterium]